MQGLDLAEIAITSDATLTADAAPKDAFVIEDVDGVAVRPGLAEGDKCERCFKVLPEVGASADWPGICHRCVDAVEHFRTAAD
jgi:isoleucyl-tRNA synthetase